MAIRPIPKEVPYGFKPATLYLDDIAEILKIFTEAENNRQEKPFYIEGESLHTTFRVASQTCDDLDDLKNIYPSFTHNFHVEVSRTGFSCYLQVNKNSVIWGPYGLDENGEWGVFHKLELIFDKRKHRWKSLLHSYSGIFHGIEGAATAFLVMILLAHPFANRIPLALTVTAFALTAILIIALRVGFRTHTVVIFRTYADHSSQKNQIAWKVVPDIVKILVGFALGLLAFYLQHKFWPGAGAK